MDEKNVFLSDGRIIALNDDVKPAISLISNGNTDDIFKLPCPFGGYGGGILLLSPSEKYLVFSYFSGESEEAFSLFEIGSERLRLVYNSGYLYGEDARYGFAKDEKILVQTVRTGFWDKENPQIDENGDAYFDFGELNLFDLEAREFGRHTIRVYPPDDWEEERDFGEFSFSEFSGDKFRVTLP